MLLAHAVNANTAHDATKAFMTGGGRSWRRLRGCIVCALFFCDGGGLCLRKRGVGIECEHTMCNTKNNPFQSLLFQPHTGAHQSTCISHYLACCA